MEQRIKISELNDFIFCPLSIYYHRQYDESMKVLFQRPKQLEGTSAHYKIDSVDYSTRKDVLQSIDVGSEEYGIVGKIDVYDMRSHKLMERKKHVNKIYDGYVYQVYAQYFSLVEMGYQVDTIIIHSLDDNKNYDICLPKDDSEMFGKFRAVIDRINRFDPSSYYPQDSSKCQQCIYSEMCDKALGG